MIHSIPQPDDSHLLAAKAQLDAAAEEFDELCDQYEEPTPELVALRLQLAQTYTQFASASALLRYYAEQIRKEKVND